MKKNLLSFLVPIILLTGCASDRIVSFEIQNNSDAELRNVEILTSEETCSTKNFVEIIPKHSEKKLIFDFTLKPGTECTYSESDGQYTLTYETESGKEEQQFGHYMSGIPLEKEFIIEIREDEFLVNGKVINSETRAQEEVRAIINQLNDSFDILTLKEQGRFGDVVGSIKCDNDAKNFYGTSTISSSPLKKGETLHSWIKETNTHIHEKHGFVCGADDLRNQDMPPEKWCLEQINFFEVGENHTSWNSNFIGESPKLSIKLSDKTVVTLDFGQDFSEECVNSLKNAFTKTYEE